MISVDLLGAFGEVFDDQRARTRAENELRWLGTGVDLEDLISEFLPICLDSVYVFRPNELSLDRSGGFEVIKLLKNEN